MRPSPKPETWRDPDYVAWVREQPCIACHQVGNRQLGPSQCAHMRTRRNHGDRWILPLCLWHHTEQHQIGIQSFLKKYNLRLGLLCKEYRALYEVQHLLREAGFP